jgi:YidC/Oxa1 family membrane protein insertase
MERRVLLAIFLAFLVLYAYQAFLVPPPVQEQAGSTGQSTPSSTSSTPGTATTAPAAASPATAPVPSATPLVGAEAERDVRVETSKVVAVFTNRGARLKSWRLKDYMDGRGEPLELVANDLGNAHALPFSLSVTDTASAATNAALNGALYAVREAPNATSGAITTASDLAFEYRDSSGLSATKHFRLEPASYTISFDAVVSQNGQALTPSIVWGPGLGDGGAHAIRSSVQPRGLFSVAGDVSRLAASDVAKQPGYEHDFEYVGIDDHYFAAIALKPGRCKATYQPVSIPVPTDAKAPPRELMAFTLDRSSSGAVSLYLGPKNFETLAVVDRNLVKAIDFGVFSVLVVPLLRSLNWINHYVGNYGWAILILTVFINVVLFPLNHKSVVSMRKMQEIQPEAKAIQERYAKLKATDPARQKMNQELMALYRERGVNPASGCVPILLTLPVFLAFYALLTTAIELRGAPFIGWMNDLSQPDRFYVMPILVGLSQLVTQWMTPQTGIDPTQQKIMLIMPLVLIFVFITTPVGALLYWLVGNVWRVGQQYLTNYLIGPPNVRTVRPAAERRVKRVGPGKAEGAAPEN